MATVFRRHDGTAPRDRPGDGKLGVVESNAAIGRLVIPACDLVYDFGFGRQGAKAVREADRHPKLQPIVGREFHRDMLPERGRTAPDIDSDVKNGPAHHPHELALGMRIGLEMQAADHTRRTGQGMIVLHELIGDARRRQIFLAVCFREEAAVIFNPARRNELDVRNCKRLDIHLRVPRSIMPEVPKLLAS
jgi:hypothetical protein